jgi:hypothetical protein
MSLNAGINATIALIEDRPEQFKEMLRAVTSDVKDIGAVRIRLNRALNFYAATKIRWALMNTLHIEPNKAENMDSVCREAFFAGVCAVEKLFEDLLAELEAK